jgi:fatty-acyl-CoA synthase
MIGLWLEKWNVFGPARVALVDAASGQRWTYGELHARAQRRAANLRDEHGIEPGDRVAWYGKNEPEFFELLFACARLGAILVPINWRLAPPEVQYVIDNVRPKLVVEEELVAAWAAEGTPSGPVAEVSCHPATTETPLLILHTSGTTGRPKGAVLTHGSITANSLNTTIACDLRSDDSTATFTPLFHTGAINVLSLPLLHRGGKVVLFPAFDAGQILSWVEREEVSILFGVPTTFEMLRDHADFASADLSKVRFSLCGGAPCPLGLIEDYARRGLCFRQGYGLTEVGPNCFSLIPEEAVRKAGTVGFPVVGCQARLVDAEGNEVTEPGAVGELWLAGEHVCAGYWEDEAATAAALQPGGWWRTGDLFTRDEEGFYRVVGRQKEMYISGGENVYPAEVEQAILTHPDVQECVVIGVADETWGEVGHAYVSPASVDPQSLKDHLQGLLARYKQPKQVFTLEALPRNAMGKVVRAEVGQLVSA